MFNLGMYDTIISYGETDAEGKAAMHITMFNFCKVTH